MKYFFLSLILCLCGCGSGLQFRPQEQKPFAITNPNTAKIFERIDAVAESVKPLTVAVEKFIESPVVDAIIPPPIRQGLNLAGVSLIALATWYLNSRKNLFKNGFNELAMANEWYYTNGGDSKVMMDAESRAINPPTIKLMRKEGYRTRIINEDKT